MGWGLAGLQLWGGTLAEQLHGTENKHRRLEYDADQDTRRRSGKFSKGQLGDIPGAYIAQYRM